MSRASTMRTQPSTHSQPARNSNLQGSRCRSSATTTFATGGFAAILRTVPLRACRQHDGVITPLKGKTIAALACAMPHFLHICNVLVMPKTVASCYRAKRMAISPNAFR